MIPPYTLSSAMANHPSHELPQEADVAAAQGEAEGVAERT